jgi:hypothetical protein
MKEGIKFRIAIRIPEIFYVLRNHESKEPDRFDEETELIKQHQSDEEGIFCAEVQLGRDQIDKFLMHLNPHLQQTQKIFPHLKIIFSTWNLILKMMLCLK